MGTAVVEKSEELLEYKMKKILTIYWKRFEHQGLTVRVKTDIKRLYVLKDYPLDEVIIEEHIENNARRIEVRLPSKRGPSRLLVEYQNPKFDNIVSLVVDIAERLGARL